MNKFRNKYKELSIQARAGIWFVICSFMQKGIAAITTPVYTRLLSTAEYGEVSIFYSWADILGLFITFGLSSSVFQRGLVKHDTIRKQYTSELISLSVVTSLISFIIMNLIKLPLEHFIDIPDDFIILIYFYVFFNTIVEFWYQNRRVEYQYRLFVALTLFMTIARPALSILCIKLFPQDKVNARIIPDAFVVVIIGFILMITMLVQGKKFFDLDIWKESMIYVLPLIPHFLSQRVLTQSDRIMISKMVGNDAAGIYSLAYSVGMLLNVLSAAIDNTLGPWAYQKIKNREYSKLGKLSESLLSVFGMCVISFSLIAPELVKIFASKDYYEAIYIIPVIAASTFFMLMYNQFIYFEYYSGKTQYVMFATFVAAGVNLVLNFIFIRLYGYIAAAYTTLVCYILYAFGHYVIMKFICKKFYKTTDKVFNSKQLLITSISVVVVSLSVLFLYGHTVIRVMVAAIFIPYNIYIGLKFVKKFGEYRKISQ